MSFSAFELSFKQAKNVGPLDQLVLFWLARHHNNEKNMCFPSHKLLAEETGLGESTVRRSINNLVSAGIIEKQQSFHKSGRQTSCSYKFVQLHKNHSEGATLWQGEVLQHGTLESRKKESKNTIPSELHDPLDGFLSNQEEKPVDELTQFWDEAKVIFEGWRIPPKRANPLIGKLLKLSGGDHKEVGRLLEEAIANGINEPIPWLLAAVSGKKKNAKQLKKQEIAEAFKELEAASERRKAAWREEYGTEYGIYPDTGGSSSKDNGLLQSEPYSEYEALHPERISGVTEIPARRVAQVVLPNRRNTNQSQIRPVDSGVGGGGGEVDDGWQ